MAFTGIRDIDIVIISFCNLDTISNLLKLKVMSDLVGEIVAEIVEDNIDIIDDFADIITGLIGNNEIDLAKKFIREVEDKMGDCEDYFELLLWQDNILEIYFSADCQCDHLVDYLQQSINNQLERGENEDIKSCLNEVFWFYEAALEIDNQQLLKFLLNQCNEDFFTCCEADGDEEIDLLIGQIKLFNRKILVSKNIT